MQPPESDHTVIDGTDTVPLVYQRKQRRGCVRLVRTFETMAHAHTCGYPRDFTISRTKGLAGRRMQAVAMIFVWLVRELQL